MDVRDWFSWFKLFVGMLASVGISWLLFVLVLHLEIETVALAVLIGWNVGGKVKRFFFGDGRDE